MRIGPLIFMHPALFMSLEAGAAQQVLREWFVPYWELAQSACLLDGGDSKHQKMAIELGKTRKGCIKKLEGLLKLFTLLIHSVHS
jgi:hypothetical protein